jgi:hypothetical protein
LFPHRPLYRQTEIEMLGQLDMVRHPDVGLEMLLVMATVIAPAATANDIALVPLMTADDIGVGIALVVVFAELQSGKHPMESAIAVACSNL